MISLNKLKKITKRKKRVGRGISAGKGKTAGRGTKGQKSRAGHSIPVGFEGGQTPLKQRLPKMRGFRRHKNIKAVIIPLDIIAKNFKSNDVVSTSSLREKGLIEKKLNKFKIIASSKLSAKGRSASGGKITASKSFKRKLKFRFVPISKTAEQMVKKAGGKIIKKNS